jgi:hypothetical protein
MAATGVGPQAAGVVLLVCAPLEEKASLVVAQEQGHRAVQQPALMDFELGSGTDRAIVFIDENYQFFVEQGSKLQGDSCGLQVVPAACNLQRLQP